MSVTGHKYRHFRAERNMTGSQLHCFSCKQTNKKGSWKGLGVGPFLPHLFSRVVFSASLISVPPWVMLLCLLNIGLLLSTSSFSVSISHISHCIVTPNVSPQSSAPYFFSTVCIFHIDLSHEAFSPCQPLCGITLRALSPTGAATYLKKWE